MSKVIPQRSEENGWMLLPTVSGGGGLKNTTLAEISSFCCLEIECSNNVGVLKLKTLPPWACWWPPVSKEKSVQGLPRTEEFVGMDALTDCYFSE